MVLDDGMVAWGLPTCTWGCRAACVGWSLGEGEGRQTGCPPGYGHEEGSSHADDVKMQTREQSLRGGGDECWIFMGATTERGLSEQRAETSSVKRLDAAT